MAGHEVCAAGAFVAVAVVLLARWCLTGRRVLPHAAAVFRHASRRTAPGDARRMTSIQQ